MSLIPSNIQIESTRYCGYTSYGQGQVPSRKPGVDNQYYKNIYNSISKCSSREIPYFNDKIRYSSCYEEDYIKPIKSETYKKEGPSEIIQSLYKYEYSHEPHAVEGGIGKGKKDEEDIRLR
jgi:hypothetical protein